MALAPLGKMAMAGILLSMVLLVASWVVPAGVGPNGDLDFFVELDQCKDQAAGFYASGTTYNVFRLRPDVALSTGELPGFACPPILQDSGIVNVSLEEGDGMRMSAEYKPSELSRLQTHAVQPMPARANPSRPDRFLLHARFPLFIVILLPAGSSAMLAVELVDAKGVVRGPLVSLSIGPMAAGSMPWELPSSNTTAATASPPPR